MALGLLMGSAKPYSRLKAIHIRAGSDETCHKLILQSEKGNYSDYRFVFDVVRLSICLATSLRQQFMNLSTDRYFDLFIYEGCISLGVKKIKRP